MSGNKALRNYIAGPSFHVRPSYKYYQSDTSSSGSISRISWQIFKSNCQKSINIETDLSALLWDSTWSFRKVECGIDQLRQPQQDIPSVNPNKILITHPDIPYVGTAMILRSRLHKASNRATCMAGFEPLTGLPQLSRVISLFHRPILHTASAYFDNLNNRRKAASLQVRLALLEITESNLPLYA